MAKFKKGESGNPAGRPVGALNKKGVTINVYMMDPISLSKKIKEAEKASIVDHARA